MAKRRNRESVQSRQSSGDRQVAWMLRYPERALGAGNDLLKLFFDGYPAHNLTRLLESGNDDLKDVAAWVASELGVEATPLLRAVAPLLKHPRPSIRFSILDCVLVCALPDDAEAVADAVLLLEDDHSGVRWLSSLYLPRFPHGCLVAASDFFEREGGHPRHVEGLRLVTAPALRLSDAEGVEFRNRVMDAILGDDPLLRRYGVAAADQVIDIDTTPIKQALLSEDDEIRKLAIDVVGWHDIDPDSLTEML